MRSLSTGGGVELPNVSYCEKENEVHYNPYVEEPMLDGHAYVDLGLPSGTKWATMNIGATGITDPGLLFAWGETIGYQDWSEHGEYKFGTSPNFTKYNSTDGLTTLQLSDDAAVVNWGRSWRMPTKKQIEELLNKENCSMNYNLYTTPDGDSAYWGITFTSIKNGNKLSIPSPDSFLLTFFSRDIKSDDSDYVYILSYDRDLFNWFVGGMGRNGVEYVRPVVAPVK